MVLKRARDKSHEKALWGEHETECAGHLLVNTGQNTATARVNAVASDQKRIGMRWKPVQGLSADEAKALAVWLNSTLGRLAMMGHRGGKALGWPTWQPRGLMKVPAADVTDPQVRQTLAGAWDKLKGRVVEQYRDGYTETRKEMDEAVSAALGLKADELERYGKLLAREPVVSTRDEGDSDGRE